MPSLLGAHPVRSQGSARERPPRLIVLFAVLMALGISVAGAVILIVVRHADTAQAQRQAIDRAHFAVQAVLRPELRAVDLSHRPSPRRARELDRVFSSRVLLQGISGARVYGPKGGVTYAIGSRAQGGGGDPSRVREALTGAVVSEVVSAPGGRLLRTYVPVATGRGAIGGVVRLDQDYASIEGAARRFSWLIAAVLEALLIVLLIAFIPALTRVSSRIRRQIDELERAATHDELTGLPNRLGFMRATEKRLAGTDGGAVLLLDIDGFSEINETLGAPSGDAILAEVADRLSYELDDHPGLARLGEDEFGLFLRSADENEIRAVAKRVQSALASPFVADGVRISVTMSIGAGLAEHGSDLEKALGRADTALAHAKQDGNQKLHVSGPEADLRDVSRLAVVAELRDALADGDLLLHYQPQSDLTTRRVRGVEALLRWDHPHDGILTADKFIGYVERGALAQEIRHFVLETAAAQWHEWSRLGLDLELAINLSPIDVLDVSLPEEVAALIDRYEIPPRRLILEITERTLIADERRARRVVDRLTGLGVRLAIDDFGTGYSSIASLRKFDVQQVKLDRSLLADVPGDPGAEAVIGGCVEIAHGVGATVVVEGIETPEQWRFASLMGCDIAQGFLVGRPTAAEDLTPLLDVPNHIPLTAV